MKKSKSVPLTILASVAALAMSGCSRKTELQRCVDQQQRIVDDRLCDQQQSLQQQPNRTPYYPRAYYPYHWWYGGSSGGRFGDSIVGGAANPTRGFSSIRAGSSGSGAHGGTSRGGFGSSMGGGS